MNLRKDHNRLSYSISFKKNDICINRKYARRKPFEAGRRVIAKLARGIVLPCIVPRVTTRLYGDAF